MKNIIYIILSNTSGIITKSSLRFSFLLLLFEPNIILASEPIIKMHEPFFTETIAFFDEEHNKRYLDEFEDETVLLVFWASWCGECSDSMVSLDVLAKDFRKLPFKIIAASEDHLGIEAIHKFYQDHELRHLEKFYDYKNALFKSMGIVGIPTAFLIIPDNKVKIEFKGRIKWHDPKIRELILSEIRGNPPMPKNSYKKPEVNYNLPQINSKNKINNEEKQPDATNNKNQTQTPLEETKENKDNVTKNNSSNKDSGTNKDSGNNGDSNADSTINSTSTSLGQE